MVAMYVARGMEWVLGSEWREGHPGVVGHWRRVGRWRAVKEVLGEGAGWVVCEGEEGGKIQGDREGSLIGGDVVNNPTVESSR